MLLRLTVSASKLVANGINLTICEEGKMDL